MRSRLRLAVVALVAVTMTAAGMGVFASRADATCTPPSGGSCGDTLVTFSLSGGAISITVPAGTVPLGNLGNTGSILSTSGTLGDTAVIDNRGSIPASWSVTISSTSFITGGASTNETVTPCNVLYSSGVATSGVNNGAGAFVPGSTTGAGKDAATCNAATPGATFLNPTGGNNQVHWNPTLQFKLATTQVAGTYSGTLTQSAV